MIRWIIRIVFILDLLKIILRGLYVIRNDDCEPDFWLRLGIEMVIDIVGIVLTLIVKL